MKITFHKEYTKIKSFYVKIYKWKVADKGYLLSLYLFNTRYAINISFMKG